MRGCAINGRGPYKRYRQTALITVFITVRNTSTHKWRGVYHYRIPVSGTEVDLAALTTEDPQGTKYRLQGSPLGNEARARASCGAMGSFAVRAVWLGNGNAFTGTLPVYSPLCYPYACRAAWRMRALVGWGGPLRDHSGVQGNASATDRAKCS